MTRVTVAICTYNRAKSGYLKQAIQSVINQTYSDINIVVYDNASTDNTEDIVHSFNDARIAYVKNQKNLGLFDNLNKALTNCETEYIVIFHDDDIMLHNMIETEVAIMDKYPEAILTGQIISITINSSGQRLYRSLKIQPRYPKNKVFKQNELITNNLQSGNNIICAPSVMFRKRYMELLNLRFDNICGPAADWLLWLQINMYKYQIIGLRIPLVKCRAHTNSTTYTARLTDQWAPSLFYIIQWLRQNSIFKTQKIVNTIIFLDLINSVSIHASKMDILSKIKQSQATYHWTLNKDNASIVTQGLLWSTTEALCHKNEHISAYFKLRSTIYSVTHATPSLYCEFKWLVKLIYYRLICK